MALSDEIGDLATRLRAKLGEAFPKHFGWFHVPFNCKNPLFTLDPWVKDGSDGLPIETTEGTDPAALVAGAMDKAKGAGK